MQGGDGVQHLDGHAPVVLAVVGEIDGRHAARAELALDSILARKHRVRIACVAQGDLWRRKRNNNARPAVG